ncbi:MAG: RsmB/NOP family class I SAM-dependent RNA methyltransferase [Ignavibacteria bacterium]|nr:RsmB/NOP family class I SAM-dependent RNA methyltransferase [Ignavibacteria bacterium]
MLLKNILKLSTEIVGIATKEHKPTDEIISRYFRAKSSIGSTERKLISEIVFLHLRFFGFTKYIVNLFAHMWKNDNTLALTLTLYINLLLYPSNIENISSLVSKLTSQTKENRTLENYIIETLNEKFSLNEIRHRIISLVCEVDRLVFNYQTEKIDTENNDSLTIISARYSIPEFILSSWIKFYPMQYVDVFKLAESLLLPAPTTLRLNSNTLSRQSIIDKLREQGINSFPTKLSPFGIQLEKRINISQNELFKKGLIEIQDEGSQLVCLACNPKPKDKILDACAGAGGKSLFLALLQNDQGEILANDTNYFKLKELQKRTRRSGLKSISIHHFKHNKHSLQERYFDIVLVDAPCSGIGTARRNPIHKWWLTPKILQNLAKRQVELMQFYSKFVKKGGFLVYSTCSLMPEENLFVVEQFMRQNPNFIPVPLEPAFDNFNINIKFYENNDFQITLFPHIHQTDGFFIAKLKYAT